MYDADYWKSTLGLEPHPEGGFYRRFFASPVSVRTEQGERPTMTAIHYLLERGHYSAWHRLRSHELWHWHGGASALIHCIENGRIVTHHLGGDSELTLTIEPHTWFAAEPDVDGDYLLVSCTVSPGFDFADFEWGDVEALTAQHPESESLIRRLSRVPE